MSNLTSSLGGAGASKQRAEEQPQSFFDRVLLKVARSRFFAISLLLHALLIVSFGGTVLFRAYQELDDFTGLGDESGFFAGDDAGEPPPEVEIQPQIEEPKFEVTVPTVQAPRSALTMITTVSPSAASFTAVPAPVIRPVINTKIGSAVKSQTVGLGSKGLPGIMGARGSASSRAAERKKQGGKDASETAVLNGLDWLKQTQNADGTWGKRFRGAMTGLALLCFLGHGETTISPAYGSTVKRAIDVLLTQASANDGKLTFGPKTGWGGSPGVYQHAIAAYALAEAYTMTKDDRLPPALKSAMGHIVRGQGPDGGWVYSFAKTTPSDTSVSGWQIQALKAAHLTELDIDGVDLTLDKAMKNIMRVRGRRGGFGYKEPEDRYSLTGVGVLALQIWKAPKKEAISKGVNFILKGPRVKYMDKDHGNLYAWYYNTQACFNMGGRDWKDWNRMFQAEIVKQQSKDGSWPPMKKEGTGKLQVGMEIDNQLYRTTLCILMLEVFYRYLPTYKA